MPGLQRVLTSTLNAELPVLTLVTGYPCDPEESANSLRCVVTARMLF
jgi:hypothetical protein